MAFLISFVGDRRGGGFGRPFFLPKPPPDSFLADSAVEEVMVFGCEEVVTVVVVVGVELICGVPTF